MNAVIAGELLAVLAGRGRDVWVLASAGAAATAVLVVSLLLCWRVQRGRAGRKRYVSVDQAAKE